MTSRIFWTLIAVSILAFAPALHAAEKQRVAVLEFTHKGAEQEAEAIAEELRGALGKSGKFEPAGPELTAQVNKAWQSQPANLTDSQKAVNVGKRFDVQLIVTGKLYKFSSGWQVSAKLLDTGTGESKKSKTYRARGDFITLLERKVPALGRILSGMEPGTQAVAGAGKPTVLREGKGIRLAIFPDIRLGDSQEESGIASKWLVKSISKIIKQNAEGVYVAYSFLDRPKEEHAGLRSSVWKIGKVFARPNMEGVRSRANALGVDVVMQVLIRVDGFGIGSVPPTVNYEAHLLEVNPPRHHRSRGNSQVVGLELLREMESSLAEVLQKYKRTAPRAALRATAGTPPPALAKLEPPKPPLARPAPAGGGTAKKLAVFAGVIVDSLDKFSADAVTGRLGRAITSKYGGGLQVTGVPGGASRAAGADDNSFLDIGVFSTDVKKDALLAAARKVGIDLAVAFAARLDPATNSAQVDYSAAAYHVFLADVKSGRIYRESGNLGWEDAESWIVKMIGDMNTLLETYARDNKISLKPAR